MYAALDFIDNEDRRKNHAVWGPYNMDYHPQRWPVPPRTAVQRCPRASHGPDHLVCPSDGGLHGRGGRQRHGGAEAERHVGQDAADLAGGEHVPLLKRGVERWISRGV